MDSRNAKSQLTLAITNASLGKLPPELRVATGHDEEVMLFLLRVGDAKATSDTLMEVIALSEAESILTALAATPGLIRKRFHIDEAHRLKDHLDSVGTAVELIRPDEVEDV